MFKKFYQKCFCGSSGSGQASVDLRLIHALNIRLTTPDYLRDNAYRKALLSALEDLPDHPEFLLQLRQVSLVAGYKCKGYEEDNLKQAFLLKNGDFRDTTADLRHRKKLQKLKLNKFQEKYHH